jgi:hypothetical protein
MRYIKKLFSFMKTLFVFAYFSPLPLEVCKERLSSKYLGELVEMGKIPRFSFGWRIFIFPQEEDPIKVYSNLDKFSFSYRFSFIDSGTGTALLCRHNPFVTFGFCAPALLAVLSVIGMTAGAIFGGIRAAEIMVTSGFIFMFTVPGCAILEYCARSAVSRYLVNFLDAKRVDYEMTGYYEDII